MKKINAILAMAGSTERKESDFATHFPQAGNKRYWNELIRELQEILYYGEG
ncbi:MAG: hypothetical protein WC645_06145 [Candidatus Margulisiibacteriota bacterium]